MPRNGNGLFTVLNPIQIGALRSSADVNEDFDDMGDELTNSLPIDGSARMLGQFQAAGGTATAPGIAFSADVNTGFRHDPDDDTVAWVAGGTEAIVLFPDGSYTFNGGIQVTGTVSLANPALMPATLAAVGAVPLTLGRAENDTSEHELVSYQSGNGSGAKGSLRVVGDGSNGAATLRFYVNDVKTFEWSSALFSVALDTVIGAAGLHLDADGFIDIPELSAAPSAPAMNLARVYARDVSGTTRLFFKDAGGTETAIRATTDQQIFTASGIWAAPAGGQTMAMIEMWGGGASGASDSGNAAGGGGGGTYVRRVIALASLSAAVSVTVGAGGVGVSGADRTGNAGGNSVFGTALTAFGGGAGAAGAGSSNGGGGGGGPAGAGFTADANGGSGGNPSQGTAAGGAALFDGSPWGFNGNCNPFGGASGGGSNISNDGQTALFGGGGGGGNDSGGSSVWGGGGGAGSSGPNGGSSVFGGNGGGPSTSGSAPGGGGGASNTTTSGAGGRGEVRITCW